MIRGFLTVCQGSWGEGFTLDNGSFFGGAETILLGVGGIPDPVDEEIGGEKCAEHITVPVVFGGMVVGDVECAVAVR